jgi:hypothetical protein
MKNDGAVPTDSIFDIYLGRKSHLGLSAESWKKMVKGGQRGRSIAKANRLAAKRAKAALRRPKTSEQPAE